MNKSFLFVLTVFIVFFCFLSLVLALPIIEGGGFETLTPIAPPAAGGTPSGASGGTSGSPTTTTTAPTAGIGSASSPTTTATTTAVGTETIHTGNPFSGSDFVPSGTGGAAPATINTGNPFSSFSFVPMTGQSIFDFVVSISKVLINGIFK